MSQMVHKWKTYYHFDPFYEIYLDVDINEDGELLDNGAFGIQTLEQE